MKTNTTNNLIIYSLCLRNIQSCAVHMQTAANPKARKAAALQHEREAERLNRFINRLPKIEQKLFYKLTIDY